MLKNLSRKGKLLGIISCISLILFMQSTVFAYTVDYAVTDHPQITDYYCGPSTAEMNLQRITGVDYSQNTIYNYAHQYNRDTTQGVDPLGLTYAMAHFTPAGYYYCNWRYYYATGAARGIANNIERWSAPIAAAINGGAHWVSVNGVYSDVYVPLNYSGSTVYGFYVTEPLYNSVFIYSNADTLGVNAYYTAYDFMTNYFTPINGGWWSGYYVPVERNANSSYDLGSYIDSNSFSHY